VIQNPLLRFVPDRCGRSLVLGFVRVLRSGTVAYTRPLVGYAHSTRHRKEMQLWIQNWTSQA